MVALHVHRQFENTQCNARAISILRETVRPKPIDRADSKISEEQICIMIRAPKAQAAAHLIGVFVYSGGSAGNAGLTDDEAMALAIAQSLGGEQEDATAWPSLSREAEQQGDQAVASGWIDTCADTASLGNESQPIQVIFVVHLFCVTVSVRLLVVCSNLLSLSLSLRSQSTSLRHLLSLD